MLLIFYGKNQELKTGILQNTGRLHISKGIFSIIWKINHRMDIRRSAWRVRYNLHHSSILDKDIALDCLCPHSWHQTEVSQIEWMLSDWFSLMSLALWHFYFLVKCLNRWTIMEFVPDIHVFLKMSFNMFGPLNIFSHAIITSLHSVQYFSFGAEYLQTNLLPPNLAVICFQCYFANVIMDHVLRFN